MDCANESIEKTVGGHSYVSLQSIASNHRFRPLTLVLASRLASNQAADSRGVLRSVHEHAACIFAVAAV